MGRPEELVYWGEARPAEPVKSVQWTDLSAERRSGARPSAPRGRDAVPREHCPDPPDFPWSNLR